MKRKQESRYITRARNRRITLLAQAKLGTSEFDSRYRWNPELGTTGRYIDRDGKIVRQTTVTKQLELVIEGVQNDAVALALDLQDGSISVQEWYNAFTEQVKVMHGIGASLAKGGWAQMESSDWKLTKEITKTQLEFLNKFAEGVDSGDVKLDGNFLRRVDQYVAASRGTGEEIRRKEMFRKATHERRVLGVADHCTTDKTGLRGCVELAALGWQPVGTLPPIGGAPCRNNCHCHFEWGVFDPATREIVKIE
jgi:hypothetical protein